MQLVKLLPGLGPILFLMISLSYFNGIGNAAVAKAASGNAKILRHQPEDQKQPKQNKSSRNKRRSKSHKNTKINKDIDSLTIDSWMATLSDKSFALNLSDHTYIDSLQIIPWPDKLPGFQESADIAAQTRSTGNKDIPVSIPGDWPVLQNASKSVPLSGKTASSNGTPLETNITGSKNPITDTIGIKITTPRPTLESGSSLGIALTQTTGTLPFDGDDNPGHDSNGTNSIVRTGDNLTYTFSYSVNGADAMNALIVMTLPSALQWTTIPAVCRTTGVTPISSIAGQAITCNLGSISNGSTGSFSAITKVLSVAHGTALTGAATISADGVAAVNSNQVLASVTAAPTYNLRKVGATIIGSSNGSDGVTKGQVVTYGIQVLVDSANYRGQEPLASSFSLTDNLSAISPNARLYNWDPLLPGCAPVNSASGLANLSPYGRIGIAAGATAENSVVDSGNFTCVQTGSTVNITITNVNTNGSSFPTKQKNATTLIPATETHYISGYIAVWIPITDIGSGINTTNTLTNFDPNSISGQSNFGSSSELNTTDNAKTFFVPGAVGGFSTLVWQNPTTTTRLPTQTGTASGDGLVAANQVYGGRYTFNNQGVIPLNNLIVCGKINNAKNIVSNIIGQASPVNVAISSGVSYVVEYAGGAYADDAAAEVGTCGIYGDSTGWTTDANAIGFSNITKVRIRIATLQPTEYVRLNVGYQALSGIVGTRIGIYGAYRADELCGGGGWRFGRGGSNGACTNTVIYDPATHTQSVGDTGDRVTLANAAVRIVKTSASSNMVAGDTMLFTLSPTITNPESTSAGVASNVTITDTLPSWLAYNLGSSSGGPSGTGQPGVTVNTGGTTMLVWNLGSQPASIPIPPITFVATASLVAPNNTSATNSVTISSPDDASLAAIRTASVTVVIGNPGEFAISKAVNTPTLNIGDDIVYTLSYVNLSGAVIPGTDMIDVLPWNGDLRTPRSNFHGTMSFKNIVVSNGEAVQYTKAGPATINNDPGHFSNQSGGATVWCSGYLIGGSCPASLAEVTAIRVTGGSLPGGGSARNVVLTLLTSGNIGVDTYTNNFGGRAQGLSLPVVSNSVNAVVTGRPLMSLLKSCPVPANCVTALQIPGTDLTYKVIFTNAGNAYAQSLVIFDPIPLNTDYKIGSQTFDPRSTGLIVTTEFSNDFLAASPDAATWAYTPLSNGGGADAGYDRNVKAIRWRVTTGNLSPVSPNNIGEAGFVVKIR